MVSHCIEVTLRELEMENSQEFVIADKSQQAGTESQIRKRICSLAETSVEQS